MTRRKNEDSILADQQLAITSYLQALLDEVPDDIPDEAGQQVLVEAPSEELKHRLEPPPPEPTILQNGDKQSSVDDRAAAPPEWANSRFQCLLFKVAGLSLAVPLVKLNGVIPWTQQLTAVPNRSPLFLGLLRHQGQNVKVVNPARIVLPEGPGKAKAVAEPRNIILVDEGRWGLACDGIGSVLSLAAADVRWRTSRGKRPWLAGTVLQHLCAVLDVDALVTLLANGGEQ